MSDFPNMILEAKKFSFERKLKFPKKMTSEVFRTEVEAAHILGECCAHERFLEYIKLHKETLTVSDLEAAIHLNLDQCLEAVALYYNGEKMFGLEDILDKHGYYKKKKPEE